MSEKLYCSFCGKTNWEVRKLIAGPGPALFICDECVELCMDICHEEFHGRVDGEAEYLSW